jgi:hypothetical protein
VKLRGGFPCLGKKMAPYRPFAWIKIGLEKRFLAGEDRGLTEQ